MKFLVMGSLNYDYIYSMDHIVKPGETTASAGMDIVCGGKGLNQSIALAKAGLRVWHAGVLGEDGELLRKTAEEYGVCCDYLSKAQGKCGHAVIQLEKSGQNSIVLYGGSNQKFTEGYVDEVLAHFGEGDQLLLQNEINQMPYIIQRASERGMRIIFNPAPFAPEVLTYNLDKISLFILNEVEGEQMTGSMEPEQILHRMKERFPDAEIILTLGEKGSVYACAGRVVRQTAVAVEVVDTTAAGDTFTGYFLAARAKAYSVEESLQIASQASSAAVGRRGAVPSIPLWNEIAG